MVIQATQGWFHFDWQGLCHYRDLLFLLVYREFASKYKQTILGPAWFILQPLLTTVVFQVVFGRGIKISTDGIPSFLFYFCALVPWSYFSQCLTGISTSLTSNASLFKKVYFPRLIVPLSIVFSNLLALVIQAATFLAFYAYFKYFTPAGSVIHPNAYLVFLPFLLLQTALTSLGAGLWVAALTVKYRDFHHMMNFLVQLWMYVTPIIYPASLIPEKYRIFLALNPMAGVVESYRFAFFGEGFVHAGYLLVSNLITFALLISGILVFNKIERNFVDTI